MEQINIILYPSFYFVSCPVRFLLILKVVQFREELWFVSDYLELPLSDIFLVAVV